MLDTKEDVILAKIEGKLDKAFETKNIAKCDGCKEACCELGPDVAFQYAVIVDPTPDDMVREAVSEDAIDSFHYAVHIDKGKPHDITRTAACKRPYTAYLYAVHIDKEVTEETKKSAKRLPSVYEMYTKHFEIKK